MELFLVDLFEHSNPYITTALMAIMPVGELRVSIPFALGIFKLSVAEAMFISIVAEIIIAFILINFLSGFRKFIDGKNEKIDKFLYWVFERSRKSFLHKHVVWGDIALMMLVAIPVPLTGVWTGALAAWLLEIPKTQSMIYITLGIIISAFLVTLISLGLFRVF